MPGVRRLRFPMTNPTTTPVAPKVPDVVAPTAATPRVVPTVSQPIRVDWGSFGEQFLVHETKMIENVAHAGLALIEGVAPMGWAIRMFVGQNVVDGLIEQGMKVLEGMLHDQSFTVDGDKHPVEAYVLSMVEHTLPNLFASLGPKLDELIKAGLAKVGITV